MGGACKFSELCIPLCKWLCTCPLPPPPHWSPPDWRPVVSPSSEISPPWAGSPDRTTRLLALAATHNTWKTLEPGTFFKNLIFAPAFEPILNSAMLHLRLKLCNGLQRIHICIFYQNINKNFLIKMLYVLWLYFLTIEKHFYNGSNLYLL